MRRDLIVTTAGTEQHVDLRREPGTGRWHATVDGQAVEVDAHPIGPRTWSLIIAGRAVVVDLETRRTGVVAHTRRSSATVAVEGAAQKRMRQAAVRPTVASAETIVAPIAGRLVKLLVEVGQVVAPGQAVAVLEAMKMENELVAERGGAVVAIKRAVGDTVDTGAPLIELRPPA